MVGNPRTVPVNLTGHVKRFVSIRTFGTSQITIVVVAPWFLGLALEIAAVGWWRGGNAANCRFDPIGLGRDASIDTRVFITGAANAVRGQSNQHAAIGKEWAARVALATVGTKRDELVATTVWSTMAARYSRVCGVLLGAQHALRIDGVARCRIGIFAVVRRDLA